ncbi:MAG: SMP-30/gluconolactonase/LRE family protein [Sulfitobacter sp.]
MSAFDTRICQLGEGPLWHPKINTLFWFDILGRALFRRSGNDTHKYAFDEYHSAAGWVDSETLVIASETALWQFDIASGNRTHLVDLEADTPITRSNDGRADPWGGFWIGTMGKNAEPQAGAIYRYHRGELRKLVNDITISNAICFAPDKSHAYYTDTKQAKIMRLPLHPGTGWPQGDAEVLVDLAPENLNPDGAVTDAAGNIWVALWGAGEVACFSSDGTELRRVNLPALQPTCPAFGGPDLRDLYVTTAAVGLTPAQLKAQPENGMTFCIPDVGQGVAEPQVIL